MAVPHVLLVAEEVGDGKGREDERHHEDSKGVVEIDVGEKIRIADRVSEVERGDDVLCGDAEGGEMVGLTNNVLGGGEVCALVQPLGGPRESLLIPIPAPSNGLAARRGGEGDWNLELDRVPCGVHLQLAFAPLGFEVERRHVALHVLLHGRGPVPDPFERVNVVHTRRHVNVRATIPRHARGHIEARSGGRVLSGGGWIAESPRRVGSAQSGDLQVLGRYRERRLPIHGPVEPRIAQLAEHPHHCIGFRLLLGRVWRDEGHCGRVGRRRGQQGFAGDACALLAGLHCPGLHNAARRVEQALRRRRLQASPTARVDGIEDG
mmetsp:Transcript_17603/g.56920  ORF Transcript_17603/g.56920 Transcript_17603/m.56920 type:complete len:321 (+) Transcript_17603:766-1728(+)